MQRQRTAPGLGHLKEKMKGKAVQYTQNEVDIAAFKATTNIAGSPKEKHVRTLILESRKTPDEMQAMTRALLKRMTKLDRVVVVKTLVVFYRLLRGDCSRYVTFLRDHKFSFASFESAKQHGNFVQSFATFLDAKVNATTEDFTRLLYNEVQRDPSGEPTTPRGNMNVVRDLSLIPLFRTLDAALFILDSILKVKPVTNFDNAILTACIMLIREAGLLWKLLNEGMINLVGRFFELSLPNARQGVRIYGTYVTATDGFIAFLQRLKQVPNTYLRGIINKYNVLAPKSLLDQMKQYVTRLEAGGSPIISPKSSRPSASSGSPVTLQPMLSPSGPAVASPLRRVEVFPKSAPASAMAAPSAALNSLFDDDFGANFEDADFGDTGDRAPSSFGNPFESKSVLRASQAAERPRQKSPFDVDWDPDPFKNVGVHGHNVAPTALDQPIGNLTESEMDSHPFTATETKDSSALVDGVPAEEEHLAARLPEPSLEPDPFQNEATSKVPFVVVPLPARVQPEPVKSFPSFDFTGAFDAMTLQTQKGDQGSFVAAAQGFSFDVPSVQPARPGISRATAAAAAGSIEQPSFSMDDFAFEADEDSEDEIRTMPFPDGGDSAAAVDSLFPAFGSKLAEAEFSATPRADESRAADFVAMFDSTLSAPADVSKQSIAFIDTSTAVAAAHAQSVSDTHLGDVVDPFSSMPSPNAPKIDSAGFIGTVKAGSEFPKTSFPFTDDLF